MPMPLKFATSRPATAHGGKASTRSAVEEIRHSTGEVLNAFLAARQLQAQNFRKGLRKAGVARKKAVRTMIEGFRHTREDAAHEMIAKLQSYIKALQMSVIKSKQETDASLRQVASKRKRLAAAQARSLAKAHKSSAQAEHKEMKDMADAREQSTQEVQSGLKRFAKGLHRDVSAFRQNLREELGTSEVKSGKPASKGKAKAKAFAPKKAKPQTVKAKKPEAKVAPKQAVQAKAKAKAKPATAKKPSAKKPAKAKK